MAIISRGTYGMKRLKWRRTVRADQERIVVPFVGPYSVLQAQQPAIGSTLPDLPQGFFVEEVTLEEGRADDGKLYVVLTNPRPGNTGWTSQNTQIGETIFELDWLEEQILLEKHPRCPPLNPARLFYANPAVQGTNFTGSNPSWPADHPDREGSQRTWEHWQVFVGSDIINNALYWPLEVYKELKEAGINDYPSASPIARRTKYWRSRPTTTGNMYRKQNPPPECDAPSGWTYVKTADRLQVEGRRYLTIEEWRGYPIKLADRLFANPE
jgi:hypothetical protein